MGKAKILRNIQGGSDEMLIIAYIVGGWVQKSLKKCLRNIWTVPYPHVVDMQCSNKIFSACIPDVLKIVSYVSKKAILFLEIPLFPRIEFTIQYELLSHLV